ncbi:MAG: lipase/acyltransferase domain-containing protein [Candidatus Binataceae bacterium]
MQRPCIVIPGIQGSALQNVYPITPQTTWSALTIAGEKFTAPDFNSLALDDAATADDDDQVLSRPSQLIEIAYGPLVQALQGRLNVPAYLFPYDWRYSIVHSAEALVQFVLRLQKKPMKSVPGWDRLFDFAVHSMGGLVLRAFLDAWQRANIGTPPPVGQIVFIATPHLGSLEAATALITGETPLFGGYKELRKLARTFPAVYELLPRFPQPVVRNGAELDVFVESNWQKNTVDPDVRNSGFDVQQVHLTAAKTVLTGLPFSTDPQFKLLASDQLVIFGNKPDAVLLQVNVGPDPDKMYDFDGATKGPGDDVVPVISARLNGVASVEIQEGDVSYFHPIERGMAAADMHAFLPVLDETATIVSRFFQGARTPDQLLPKGLPMNRFYPASS